MPFTPQRVATGIAEQGVCAAVAADLVVIRATDDVLDAGDAAGPKRLGKPLRLISLVIRLKSSVSMPFRMRIAKQIDTRRRKDHR
jgi:hypothetical protein